MAVSSRSIFPSISPVRPGRSGELDGKIERLETAIAALDIDGDAARDAVGDR